MPFIILCQKCHAQQEPTYDKVNDVVICSECDEEIPNISPFTKKQLKPAGKSNKTVQTAFSIKCGSCGKTNVPDLKGDKGYCKHCKVDMNVPAVFIHTMKTIKPIKV